MGDGGGDRWYLPRSVAEVERGPEGWLRFFELAGSVFAREEGSSTAPNVPADPATLLAETRTAAENARVGTRLQAFSVALDVVGEEKEQEKRLAGAHGDVVLVASDSLASLRRAFPNYFGDTRTFVKEMRRLITA